LALSTIVGLHSCIKHCINAKRGSLILHLVHATTRLIWVESKIKTSLILLWEAWTHTCIKNTGWLLILISIGIITVALWHCVSTWRHAWRLKWIATCHQSWIIYSCSSLPVWCLIEKISYHIILVHIHCLEIISWKIRSSLLRLLLLYLSCILDSHCLWLLFFNASKWIRTKATTWRRRLLIHCYRWSWLYLVKAEIKKSSIICWCIILNCNLLSRLCLNL